MASESNPSLIYKNIHSIWSECEQNGSWFKIRSVVAYLTRHSLKAQVAYGYITQLVMKAHKVAKVTTQMEIWHAAEGIHWQP